ncbi:MAG: GDSL-type esterase/lipase family protein [Pygmaiobacter sp.]
MKKHILCVGDSNTHGYCADPCDCADGVLLRFCEGERWTSLLQTALGEEYLVIEEGLSGRTTVFRDPLYEGLAAMDYIVPCLKSHEPIALLLLMLGTNDTKERFAANAACIALGMERLVHKAQAVDCWGSAAMPNILIVSPPVIDPRMECSVVGPCMGAGCAAKSRQLPPLLAEVAQRTGCHYLSAEGCELNSVDYMHLTRHGHAQLAALLARTIPILL